TPRAAGERAQGSVAGAGATRLGTDNRGGGDTPTARAGQRSDRRRSRAVGGIAGRIGRTPATPRRTPTLSPRPRRLLTASEGQTHPAEFANVEKNYAGKPDWSIFSSSILR